MFFLKTEIKYRTLNYLISAVWLANGLVCKVLNLVPRHEKIVGRILGTEFSKPFTIVIGISEIIMAVWILTGVKSRLNAIVQMIIVATMNIIEFILVPDLLLWGRLNLLFAILFVLLIFYNEFVLHKQVLDQA